MKKTALLYAAIAILIAVIMWQWVAGGSSSAQLQQIGKYAGQLHMLSGIGPLRSAHLHADVKVYINGKAVDFSQGKYQLTTDFIHFEEGIGDVTHTHATGLTIGHLLNSVGIGMSDGCIDFEGNKYCNEKNKTIKFYVNGKLNDEFSSYEIRDLDRYLVSYGAEGEEAIKKQLDSVTNLAQKYSGK